MAQPPAVKQVTLEALSEYRIELEPGEAISITLLQGSAEVFGFELVPGQPYPFGNEVRAAVWTSEGAELEISPSLLLRQARCAGIQGAGRVELSRGKQNVRGERLVMLLVVY